MSESEKAARERDAVIRFIKQDAAMSERLAAEMRDGSHAGEINALTFEHHARIKTSLAEAIEAGVLPPQEQPL